jgi:AcrR family transcriptional regulator
MPKVTEAYREARRQQILRAAFACFGREGVRATTMQDICEEADLSPGAVYNYFDGKADIIAAIAAKSRGSLEVLFEAVEGAASATEELLGLIEQLGAFVEKPGDEEDGGHRVRVRLWGEALSASDVHEHLEENQVDFVDRLTEVIRNGQEEGAFDEKMSPKALARAVLALHQGMVLQKTIAPASSVTPVFEAVKSLIRDATS